MDMGPEPLGGAGPVFVQALSTTQGTRHKESRSSLGTWELAHPRNWLVVENGRDGELWELIFFLGSWFLAVSFSD